MGYKIILFFLPFYAHFFQYPLDEKYVFELLQLNPILSLDGAMLFL